MAETLVLCSGEGYEVGIEYDARTLKISRYYSRGRCRITYKGVDVTKESLGRIFNNVDAEGLFLTRVRDGEDGHDLAYDFPFAVKSAIR